MAKKDNKKNKNKEVVERSKFEKYYNIIIVALAVIAIAVVLIIFIPKSGKSNEYTRDYEYLPYENVYEKISIDDLKNKINEKETFHLVVCDSSLKDANYFMYYLNELAIEEEVSKVYYIKVSDLKGSDKPFFTIELGLGKDIFDMPNVLFFDNGVAEVQTYTIDLNEYTNSWERLVAYFELLDEYTNLNE